MIKQLFLPLAGAAIFVAFVGILVKNPEKLGINPTKEVIIKDKRVIVTTADTSKERVRGLSKVSSLGEDKGMLFVFDSKDVKPAFWMKDMLIPIDIIWIDNDKIVQMDKNIEAPEKGTPDSELKLYKPQNPIDYVLEVNAGFSEKNDIRIGDEMRFGP